MTQPLKTNSILPRLDGIEADLEKLEKLARLDQSDFSQDENFHLSQFYLRRVLEGMFNIGSHILSRLNGGRSTAYKDIALKLGEYQIVEAEYAQKVLVPMAGYRNRLTHFYADIKPEELHQMINTRPNDVRIFNTQIKALLKSPDEFGLTLEWLGSPTLFFLF